MKNTHRENIRYSSGLYILFVGFPVCPESHPYAFDRGRSCCNNSLLLDGRIAFQMPYESDVCDGPSVQCPEEEPCEDSETII